MKPIPRGAQLAIGSVQGHRPIFYKEERGKVLVWTAAGVWVTTSFSSLLYVVDMWDEVHTWL